MSKVKWAPPRPGGPATRIPPKVVFEGVPPNTAEADLLLQRYHGRISQFYAKASQATALTVSGQDGYRKVNQTDEDGLRLQYSVNNGQEIIRARLPVDVARELGEPEEAFVPWDYILVEMPSTRYDHNYFFGGSSPAWAYGAAETTFVVPQGSDADEPWAASEPQNGPDEDRNSTYFEVPVLSWAGPSTYNTANKLDFGTVASTERVTTSLLIDIRRFKTYSVMSFNIYAKATDLGVDYGPLEVVDVEIIGYYEPDGDVLERYYFFDGRIAQYHPVAAAASTSYQIGPAKVNVNNWYFQGYAQSSAPEPTEAELVRAAAEDPNFFAPGGGAENPNVYSTFSSTDGGIFQTDGNGAWVDAATTPNPSAPDGTNPNDWYAQYPATMTITPGPPAEWGAEWGPMTYTREYKHWTYSGQTGTANQFPIPEGEANKIYNTAVERRVVLIGPIEDNPTFEPEADVVVDIEAAAFRGEPQWGYSTRPSPDGQTVDYFTWDTPETINPGDRLKLNSVAKELEIPNLEVSDEITPAGPLKERGYRLLGTLTFEQKSGGFSFKPADGI